MKPRLTAAVRARVSLGGSVCGFRIVVRCTDVPLHPHFILLLFVAVA